MWALLNQLCNAIIENNLYEAFKLKWETNCIISCQVEKKTTHIIDTYNRTTVVRTVKKEILNVQKKDGKEIYLKMLTETGFWKNG